MGKLVGLRMKFKNKSQSFQFLDGKVIIYSTNLKLWDGGKVLTLRSEIRPYTSTLFKVLLNLYKKLNSCQLTLQLMHVLVKFSPLKCITRMLTQLFLEITLVST